MPGSVKLRDLYGHMGGSASETRMCEGKGTRIGGGIVTARRTRLFDHGGKHQG
jgi:hypothetical protein